MNLILNPTAGCKIHTCTPQYTKKEVLHHLQAVPLYKSGKREER